MFEWHVVEGLVRCAASRSEANVPGSQKAEKARRQGLPLSAGRYLKTPTIFGFHGVYRLWPVHCGSSRPTDLRILGSSYWMCGRRSADYRVFMVPERVPERESAVIS